MSKEISVLSSDDISAVLATINLIQTPVYLIDIDRTGTLRYFAINQSEEEAVEYSCGQACGQSLEDVLDPIFRNEGLRPAGAVSQPGLLSNSNIS